MSVMTLLLSFFYLTGASAQPITVKGVVTDEGGCPLTGCSVVVKNTSRGIITDIDGKYSISVSRGNILVFSYIGYNTREIEVTGERIDVSMIPQVALLEDCVVVGLGHTRKTQKEAAAPTIQGVQMVSDCSMVMMYENSYSTEEYNSFSENRFRSAKEHPLSTFSIDVDAASYSNMRRFVNQGAMPDADAVRTEELVNYFSYNYPQPKGSDPVSISVETGNCPWNKSHRLVKIGIKAREIADKDLPSSNLVFLIDVSGSMYGPTRLELVKSSLKLLVNNLRDEDKVAIVVYAGSAGEVLPSTPGSDKQKIKDALDRLTAGGSTAGGAGIKLAYKIAKDNFIKGGNNRIILCTDGDFNVGVSSVGGLESLIEKERQSGVFLTVLGYGMGNYKDNRMQTLAEKGNGNHAYIDNLQEANKVLVQEFGGTIFTVAKDVKLQIEFNPSHVQSYRLVGYESRLLNNEDFNDDTKDAGEMGAGHTVTAFYEIIPVGVKSHFANAVDALKYQEKTTKENTAYTNSEELLTVKLRYKQPDGNTSKKMEVAVIDNRTDNVSADFRFASAVAMFGQLLRDSPFKGDATYEQVITLARKGLDEDPYGYRREFIRLAELAKGMNR